jgi:hypothetical protein
MAVMTLPSLWSTPTAGPEALRESLRHATDETRLARRAWREAPEECSAGLYARMLESEEREASALRALLLHA